LTAENRTKLANRVIKAAEAALVAQHHVAPVDVLVGIGWLDGGAVQRWPQGQVSNASYRRICLVFPKP